MHPDGRIALLSLTGEGREAIAIPEHRVFWVRLEAGLSHWSPQAEKDAHDRALAKLLVDENVPGVSIPWGQSHSVDIVLEGAPHLRWLAITSDLTPAALARLSSSRLVWLTLGMVRREILE